MAPHPTCLLPCCQLGVMLEVALTDIVHIGHNPQNRKHSFQDTHLTLYTKRIFRRDKLDYFKQLLNRNTNGGYGAYWDAENS